MATLTQLVSYPFSIVENPLSFNGQFQTIPTLPTSFAVIAPGVCQSAQGNTQQAGAYFTGGQSSWSNDQYAEVTLLTSKQFTPNPFVGPVVRHNPNPSTIRICYACNFTGPIGVFGGTAVIRLINGATNISIASAAGLTFSVGDKLRITAIGNTISCSQNGVTLASVVDNTVSSGFPGFSMNSATDPSFEQISNFAAGGIPVSGYTATNVSNISLGQAVNNDKTLGNTLVSSDESGEMVVQLRITDVA